MTVEIKNLIASQGFLICPSCDGNGEISYFCGHESTTNCRWCGGNGIVKSIQKQKHNKPCGICNGKEGGCGGCHSERGVIEWESYEL